MGKRRLIGLVFLLIVFTVLKQWVAATSARLNWAIELAGGETALGRDYSATLSKGETIYLDSLRLRLDKNSRKTIESIRGCDGCDGCDSTEGCINIVLAKINLAVILGAESNAVLKILDEVQRGEDLDLSSCQVKFEIAYMIVAVQEIMKRPESQTVAKYLIKKIKAEGGFRFPLNGPVCKRYFFENPHIAKAYLGHVAFLVGVAEGRGSLGWIYLVNRYGSAALIR